ncbi:peptidyl-prolyl cis-trans isomerase [Pelobacter seleniigenes]|uniref:peptidylprolyl isomerase n=1 Tax=Pelobacter seleniigenes TaxID=407188 RepID=UPI0004A776A4|nr:peptidylprolyl isomerase [Pelobacter seleniigenes]
MKFSKRLTVLSLFLLITSAASAMAFAGADQHSGGMSVDELGRDLAVELQIPLFDPSFAETPVASVQQQPVFLKDLTPALEQSQKILFWNRDTSPAELSRQFKQALDDRVKSSQTQPEQLTLYAATAIENGQLLRVSVPLFSPLFAETPVALVNEVPVTVAEFSQDLQSVHSEFSTNETASNADQNIQQLMERMIAVRLVEQEARNIGFDQTSQFRSQATEFAQKSLLYSLLNKQVEDLTLDEAQVNELYEKISLQGKFASFRFQQEADVTALQNAYKAGGDFDTLIAAAVAKGQAVPEQQQDYIPFKNLLTNIAAEASNMEIGAVSQIFRKADGFLIFKLLDKKFIEDPKALEFARNNVWKKQTATAGSAYIDSIIAAHTEYDTAAMDSLDFSKIKTANPDISLGDALQPLLTDQRTLVTIDEGTPATLTVAELAEKIKETYFHGVDTALDAKEANLKKEELLEDILFRIVGTAEAEKLGLHETAEYRRKIAEFERKTLFDIFMQKVITPEVRLTEDEIKGYYDSHLQDYMTPAMFRIKSLPFYSEQDAQSAAEKLRSGSDFKWVSANADGLVAVQNKDLLQFDRNILSLSSLPQNLQQQAAATKRGDTLLYADPNNFFYVLYFEDVFAAEPRPYQQVRKELLNIVYQNKVKKTLDEWVAKLKDAYETRIFLAAKSH